MKSHLAAVGLMTIAMNPPAEGRFFSDGIKVLVETPQDATQAAQWKDLNKKGEVVSHYTNSWLRFKLGDKVELGKLTKWYCFHAPAEAEGQTIALRLQDHYGSVSLCWLIDGPHKRDACDVRLQDASGNMLYKGHSLADNAQTVVYSTLGARPPGSTPPPAATPPATSPPVAAQAPQAITPAAAVPIRPPAPIINVISDDDIIEAAHLDTGLDVTGTAQANASLTVTIGGSKSNIRQTTTVDAAGNWAVFFHPNEIPRVRRGYGANAIVEAMATDAEGDLGLPTRRTVRLPEVNQVMIR